MAKDAVDAPPTRSTASRPSCTENVPLLGAEGYEALCNNRAAHRQRVRAARGPGRAPAQPVRLADLRAARADRGGPELAEPLEGADDYLKVEARTPPRHEGALHLDDILTRRTRISIETWDRGVAAAAVQRPRLVAPVLGWDEATIDREVEYYTRRVEAERESQDQLDDPTADAARLGAPDIVSPA